LTVSCSALLGGELLQARDARTPGLFNVSENLAVTVASELTEPGDDWSGIEALRDKRCPCMPKTVVTRVLTELRIEVVEQAPELI
jgi:hypothetical protein